MFNLKNALKSRLHIVGYFLNFSPYYRKAMIAEQIIFGVSFYVLSLVDMFFYVALFFSFLQLIVISLSIYSFFGYRYGKV
jgi:hypothetical protein